MKKIISIIISVSMVISVIVAINLSASAASSKTVSGTFNYSNAAQVLELVNEQRTANGLSKLIMTEDLTESAMLRAAEITVSFSHTRPNGDSCYTAFNYTSAAGENIAYGQSSAAAVMDGWMNSSGHRANILSSSFTKMGIGCFVYNGRLYWVQVFSGGKGISYVPSGTKDVTVDVSLVSGVDTTVSANSALSTTKATTSAATTAKETTAAVQDTTAKETTAADKTTAAQETTTSKVTTTAKPSTTVKETTTSKPSSTVNQTTAANQTTAPKPSASTNTSAAAKPTTNTSSAVITVPCTTRISCISAESKGFTVKWAMQSSAEGYQIRYGTLCNMLNAKTVTITDSTKVSETISDLKANKKYYVQVRTYKTVDGKKYYSSWSAKKSVTTKC